MTAQTPIVPACPQSCSSSRQVGKGARASGTTHTGIVTLLARLGTARGNTTPGNTAPNRQVAARTSCMVVIEQHAVHGNVAGQHVAVGARANATINCTPEHACAVACCGDVVEHEPRVRHGAVPYRTDVHVHAATMVCPQPSESCDANLKQPPTHNRSSPRTCSTTRD